MQLFPPPPDAMSKSLESVIERALAAGVPEPSWIAIDDGEGRWVAMAAHCSARERARGVVAASSDESLSTAQKLGIGGAMWLPPAYLGAMDAFGAADSTSLPVEGFDSRLIDLLEHGTAIQLVTFADCRFWKVQLGDHALGRLLAEMASALNTPAAILPWPAVVVPAENPTEIYAVWRDIAAGRLSRCPDLAIASLAFEPGEKGALETVLRCLLKGVPQTDVIESKWKEPVHELPSGRQIGWWLSRQFEELPSDGLWCAVPVSGQDFRCRWEIQGGADTVILREALTSSEVDEWRDVSAIRMPGWAASGLGPGTPAGLLAARLADAATRLDVPLWIPGVDQNSLRFVLSLPGIIWIDGPAVPRKME